MQPWPWCTFGRLREILLSVHCNCELIVAAGVMTDLNGEPTPALYGFTREVNGELLLAQSRRTETMILSRIMSSVRSAPRYSSTSRSSTGRTKRR